MDFQVRYAEGLLETIKPEDWQRLSCGAGTKGERYSEWARVRLCCIKPEGYSRWFLFRRDFSRESKNYIYSYYQAFAPSNISLEVLVWVAGQRWRIEECFQFGKSHLGLAAARSSFLDWLASTYCFSSGSRCFLICFALST